MSFLKPHTSIRHLYLGLFVFICLLYFVRRTTSTPSNFSVAVKNVDTTYYQNLISIPKALLASRFGSLNNLNQVVDFKYSIPKKESSSVEIRYRDGKNEVVSTLNSGVDQGDLIHAKESEPLEKASLVLKTPYSIRNRRNLKMINFLARRRRDVLGAGDVAFYDLAESLNQKINTPELAYKFRRDSSEKGYINTFNHVTAQALITILFDKQIADHIADLHELYHMPELTHGRFTELQLLDTLNYPVDNYIDIINNEIGQDLGLRIKQHYNISKHSVWTASLLSSVLNDLELYYSRSFGIGFEPFHENEDLMKRFSEKINLMRTKNID